MWIASASVPVARARVVAVLGADVDVQALELGRLAPVLLGLEQVDRLLADDAGHRAVARGDLDPLADEDHGIPAADAGEPEEAVVVDVVDDQADLVDVADDRHRAAVAGAGHKRPVRLATRRQAPDMSWRSTNCRIPPCL